MAVKKVEGLPMELIWPGYTFGDQAWAVRTARPGLEERLWNEIGLLQNCLPKGIFVRYVTNRPDIMKALVVGPKKSPYADGLFEFDTLCDGHLPRIYFKTTCGGTVWFNSFLAADGQVRIPLLGGSSSSKWKPVTVTVLNLLVTIQREVMCKQPYYNEPRHKSENLKDDSSSTICNNYVRWHTFRHAMLPWLTAPSIWQDVVQEHFIKHEGRIRENADQFLNKIETWLPAQAEVEEAVRSFQNAVEKLHTAN